MARTDSYITGIKAQYTFDQLIVGSHNQMAAAASLQVAKQLGEAYNPLFLYGPTGVGKTHMMQAIAHAGLAHDPALKVKYISAERFVNEVISSIAEDNLVGLRQHYGQLDLLLIDDVQFILESKSTQGEFLHVFNNLHQQNRQVVLTCDRSPSQLTALEKSIRSRLEWGLAADIKIPDLLTRMEILRLKQKNYGLTISDESIRYVSELLNSNVRELEGFLKRLHAYVTLSHQEVTMELIRNVISEIIPEGTESRTVPADLVAVPMQGSMPILASMMDLMAKPQPIVTEKPVPISPPPAPVPVAAEPPVVSPEPELPTPVPVAQEIPVPYKNGNGASNGNGKSHSNGTHELENAFDRLPDLAPPVPAPSPSPISALKNDVEVPEITMEPAPEPPLVPPAIVRRIFEPPVVDTPVEMPAPAREFKKAPIVAPSMDEEVSVVASAPVVESVVENESSEILVEDMDEPLPPGHKEIFAVFFFPVGYEKQLDTVVRKFQEVVKKHKLKFRLRRVVNHVYNHKGKINYSTFVDVCKQNKVPVAIVIGPPPAGSMVTEHEFYDLLSVTLDVQGVSLQMVSWSEIDKDYRYLNLALDIALVRTGKF